MPEEYGAFAAGVLSGTSGCYLCYADQEAACDSLKKRLEDAGVKVILEIGEGLYPGYPVIHIVRDAERGYQNMLRDLRT